MLQDGFPFIPSPFAASLIHFSYPASIDFSSSRFSALFHFHPEMYSLFVTRKPALVAELLAVNETELNFD
jgi:hypothetical protein